MPTLTAIRVRLPIDASEFRGKVRSGRRVQHRSAGQSKIKLEAALPGFRLYVQTGIVLQVGSSPVINPVLGLGQVSEQVEVQANAAMVETRNSGVGYVIENQRILELPLNGRGVTELITLSGAAVQTGEL